MKRRFALRAAIAAAMLVLAAPNAVLAGGKAEHCESSSSLERTVRLLAKACVAMKRQNTYSPQRRVNN